ncbi:YopJ family acetyltransferase [Serratia marcescens]|uniref:YopJ family acetyltransferase n=1 Tax=Serratia marcescens TaxID=615 RepID=UPI000D73813F|nr:YopJ family acetyltransferase [Serratia marcescens]AWO77485.1 avirulence protein [Serratia marcescens]
MNIWGLRGRQHNGTPAEAETSSSTNTSSAVRRTSTRMQRQDEVVTTNRYHAYQVSTVPEQARAAERHPIADFAERGELSALPPRSPLQRQYAQRDNTALNGFYEAMLRSNKMLRSAPILDQPEIVPQRLQEKADAVVLPQLKKLHKDLYEYAKLATENVQNGNGSNSAITRLDKKLLPLLADMENHRNPGLNLRICKSSEECFQTIRDQYKHVQQSKQPMNMRIIYPPFKGATDHHITLDVKLTPGHRPSIIGFESALDHMMGSIKGMISTALHGAKVHMVGNIIQNSEWDCVMFSLNNALKSHKHHDDYTDRLHNGERGKAIPAEFLKHAQSKTFVEGHSKQDNLVTKDKGGLHTETLLHRNLAYRANRFDKSYSTSIEGFRLQEIKRAGDFLAAQRKKS